MMLKNCFGCVSLQKGSIFVALLNIVSVIVATILLWIALNNSSLNFQHDEIAYLTWFVFIGIYIYTIIMAIFAGAMIFGSVRGYPPYVFPWTALTFASIFLTVAFGLAAAINFWKHHSHVRLSDIITCYLCGILFIALQIYFGLIAYSHYHELVTDRLDRLFRFMMNAEFIEIPINPHRKVQTPSSLNVSHDNNSG